MTVPDRVVFNAEPLVAHADDEPSSDVVETYLDAVADVVNQVQLPGCRNAGFQVDERASIRSSNGILMIHDGEQRRLAQDLKRLGVGRLAVDDSPSVDTTKDS